MPLYRYPESIVQAIHDKYCPMVPGPKPKDGGERPQVKDPDVLYVGPFLDGLCIFAPEIVGRATWPSDSTDDDARRRIKHLLSSVEGSGRGSNWNARNISMRMTRKGWPAELHITERISEREPGELLNSYQMLEDPETGEMRAWEFVKKDDSTATTTLGDRKAKPFIPVIREDKRFGLHYLRRGDKISFQFTHRRIGVVLMEFLLRPLSEGSSLMTPADSAGVLEW